MATAKKRTHNIPKFVKVWWTLPKERKNGMGRVLKAVPYTGRYKEWYTHVLTVEAPNCYKRELEIAYDARVHGLVEV
jgi:hypothetical protein